ncbi:hypothetical protein TIFTF001_054681, partial [Ficus carica]
MTSTHCLMRNKNVSIRKTPQTDGDMESSNAWKVADPIQVPVGPFTRARAKKFKE